MDPNTGHIYTEEEARRLDEKTQKRLVHAPAEEVKKLVRRMRIKRRPLSDAGSVVRRSKRQGAKAR